MLGSFKIGRLSDGRSFCNVLWELLQNGGDERKIEELQASLYRSFAVEEKGPWTVHWRTVIVEFINISLSAVKLDFVGSAFTKSFGLVGRIFFGKDDEGKDKKPWSVISSERVDKLASVLERKTIERHVQQVQSIEQFLDEFKTLIHTKPREGHREKKYFARSYDRPGCYEEFQWNPRSPLQRFCSHSCRRALERVLERERHWRERQPEPQWISRQRHSSGHSPPPSRTEMVLRYCATPAQ
jgi:hypothetical protein